jgi:type II secretory pathway pseudopilin PulG
MNISRSPDFLNRGISLIEAVIAMSVLAVVIPLVFGALAVSGKSAVSAEAETRSSWVIPICMDELMASRGGFSRYFPHTASQEAFPEKGNVWALGFSPEGKLLGKLDKSIYDKGTITLDGQTIRYIVTLSSTNETTTTRVKSPMWVKITMEYPAGFPSTRRQKLDFYTHIP